MNIFANKGHKVSITNKSRLAGYKYDTEKIDKNLKIGNVYTVDHTEVGGSSTAVYIQETPGIPYNSCNFIDMVTQSNELDEKHQYFIDLNILKN